MESGFIFIEYFMRLVKFVKQLNKSLGTVLLIPRERNVRNLIANLVLR